jgi:glycosyltransferase involved in cell wall biosynthesis
VTAAVRVLHLIDPASPGGGACTLRLLAEPLQRLRSIDQDVIVLGGRRHVDLARRCGVEPIGMITPPARLPVLSHRALRGVLDVREGSAGRYDVIHAWTLPSAMLATAAAPDHRRVATLTVGPVSGLAARIMTNLLEHHPMPLLAASSAVEQEYRSLGIDEQRLAVLPPATNPQSAWSTPRETLRRRWGVNDQTLVVGLLSEPVCWADARVAINVVSRAVATGRAVRLVLHHSAARRAEAERWARDLGHDGIMIVDDDVAEPWRVVPGLDAAMLIGGDLNSMDLRGTGSPFAIITGGGRRLRPMPGIMPLLWAMSAGVPVVAEASDAVRDVIEDGRTGLLVNQHDINAGADRLCRLFDDSTIAGRIGTAARAAVNERFHVSAYCTRLRELYEGLVAPVEEQAANEASSNAMGRARVAVSASSAT